ncbi:MAG: histidine phosphatase family protein [Myxococcota bacterium]
MSTLFIVRHAQASASGPDYDMLTSHGHEQARRLGAHWAGRRLHPDHAFIGPCRRHRETFEAVREAYGREGLAMPEPISTPRLDEVPTVALTKRVAPELAKKDPQVAAWLEGAFGIEADAQKNLQRLVEHVTRLYAAAQVNADGLETYADFRVRIDRWVREEILPLGRGKTAVAFTSGGPVAAAVGCALALTDQKVIDVMGMVRNASFSEFRFDARRLSLVSFNTHPHLAAEWVTQI